MIVTRSLTHNVVGGTIGVVIVWAAFAVLGLWWGLAAAAALAYEAWTLANRHEHDTISDIIRIFSRQQLMVPWMFGFGFGVAVAKDYVTDIYLAVALAVLQGHWFFTLNERRVQEVKREAEAEVKAEKQEAKAEVKADIAEARAEVRQAL